MILFAHWLIFYLIAILLILQIITLRISLPKIKMTNDFLLALLLTCFKMSNTKASIYLASDDLNMKPNIFVTQAFINRDRNKIWIEQLNKFSSDTGSIIHILSSSTRHGHTK